MLETRNIQLHNLEAVLRLWAKKLIGPYMQRYANGKEMFSYLQSIVPAFTKERLSDQKANKRLLIASMGSFDAKTEAIYAKALEDLGYETHIITMYDPYVEKIFNTFGIHKIHFYDNYFKNISLNQMRKEAESCLENFEVGLIRKLARKGIYVGKYAVSSVMRQTRKSIFDAKKGEIKSLLMESLTQSMRAAEAAAMILDKVKPDLVFVCERGYSPAGQLFDLCMHLDIPVIHRCSSHKSGREILKRLSAGDMKFVHPQSLSEKSWQYMKEIPFSEDLWDELYGELENTYRIGDWFSEVGTQFNKVLYPKEELISKLNIEIKKKTAIIFPHIFWDETAFGGEDLFKDYKEWFINVLKVATDNTRLNWIIKVHPANVIKAKRDNYQGGYGEIESVHETLGKLPDHIKLIPPESNINTFGLFKIMDYCLTVRGTIGIESAVMGINTLTAGTGRYDRLGFTHDFDSREEYLDCIRSLDNIPPMTEETKELARRYAYGLFILRPIHLDLLEHGYKQDEKGTMRFKPLFNSRDEFEKSSFVQELRNFVKSDCEDYLNTRHMPITENVKY